MLDSKPFYKGLEVTIINDTSAADGLVCIEYVGKDDPFWVRRDKLVFPRPSSGKVPVFVKHAVPDCAPTFVNYLQSKGYTLHVVCRSEAQVDQAKAEYRDWSGGKELFEGTFLEAFDGSQFDREWFLIFHYDPSIDYPFSVLERGTGGGKRQKFPVAWHRKGTIESCYAAVAEGLIRAGLEAQYKPVSLRRG